MPTGSNVMWQQQLIIFTLIRQGLHNARQRSGLVTNRSVETGVHQKFRTPFCSLFGQLERCSSHFSRCDPTVRLSFSICRATEWKLVACISKWFQQRSLDPSSLSLCFCAGTGSECEHSVYFFVTNRWRHGKGRLHFWLLQSCQKIFSSENFRTKKCNIWVVEIWGKI